LPVILSVQSSPNIEGSASRAVSRAFIDRYVEKHPDSTVVELDLIKTPPSHFNTDHLGAFFAPAEAHGPGNAAALAASNAYVEQLLAADVVVLGTPMHNFGVASVMKSWVDNIVRMGRTFRYDETGTPVGLVPQKKVVIVVGSGGIYSSDAMSQFDHAGKYLASVFGFLGMTDITIIRAEGLALGPEVAAKAMTDAKAQAAASA